MLLSHNIARSIFAAVVRVICGTHVRLKDFTFIDRQRIFYANHSSHLDFLAIWAALPPRLRNKTRPVAALDYWQHGRIKRYLSTHLFNAVYVDRTRVDPQANTLAAVEEALRSGDSIIIFPEGTRSPDGQLQPFKSGLFHLMTQFPQIEIVPVYLQNLNRILPKGELLLVPILSSTTFGPALVPTAGETKRLFLSRAEEALKGLML